MTEEKIYLQKNSAENRRTYGDVTVKFSSADEAKAFDNYLNSTMTIEYGGKVIDSYTVKDKFDPVEFFCKPLDIGNN